MKWSLVLSLYGPHGERQSMAVELAENVASEIARIDPPMKLRAPFEVTIEDVVTVLRRKEFRKSLFRDASANLGALLAERMEDAEGWHDVERIEPAKKQLAR